jgi:hypothetical protein
MNRQHLWKFVVGGSVTALCAAPMAASAAGHATAAKGAGGAKVVASGLNGPAEIQFGPAGKLFIVNRDTGDVVKSSAKGGHGRIVFKRAADSGVAPIDGNTVYLLTGEGGKKGDKLFRGNPQTGKVTKVASLLKFEKAHNPDGQKQCVGKNCDSISNAYFLLKTTHNLLIADAGANDIVAYNLATGSLHTYHVFPNIRDTKQCKNAKNNDPKHPGCDPVPTGLALGPNGTLFVSLLGAESPGAAKVVELDLQTGTVMHTWGHLSSVDGVAVSPTGVVYASELEAGLNPSKPNPNKVGRIVRIDPGHPREYAQVATPSGLTWHDGFLYAGSHSVDGAFFHQPNKGEVVRVAAKAFKPHK